MIYTCTVNPSLDYYLTFDSHIQGSVINRAVKEDFDAGGKGVNVSIVLNNLMIPNVALGFLGGFTKDYYLSFIKKYSYIEPLFTSIKDNTRINLKIFAGESIDINAKGPHISGEEFDRFKKRLYRIYPGDIFVLSGNVQQEIAAPMIDLIHELKHNEVKIVLDTDINFIRSCLDASPYLLRINEEEAKRLTEEEDSMRAIEKIYENGAKNVIMPIVDRGSLFRCDEGFFRCLHSESESVNTTGMSDSMVAGYLYAIQKGANSLEAFKYANAAAIATVLNDGLASRKATEDNFDLLKVEAIK